MIVRKSKNTEKKPQPGEVLRLLQERGLQGQENALAFITLSVGVFSGEDLPDAIEFAIRCFNNLLDRQFIKKTIRTALNDVYSSRVLTRKYRRMCSPYSIDDSFWRFYRRKVKEVIPGGWRGIELEPSQTGLSQYNLHFHALCECEFIPQPLISTVWEDVVRTPWKDLSFSSEGIAYITRVPPTHQDVGNIVRYIVKTEYLDKDSQLCHSRLYSRFGNWYDLKATNREAVGRTSES
jgi:hypothetical protein